MGPTKQLVFGAIVATVIFLDSAIVAFANEETKFVATAYYSPLPNQSKYITGSYEGDKRLNGEGVTTASGKGVFPGLLAAPSNYPFGTKIYFEGYGIGSVEDRGGAIVKAGQRGHSYDRIDIWMGYGDEGLDRALNWGKRTITGKIVVPSAEITLSFPQSKIGNIPRLTVNPEVHEFEDVVQIQEVFTKADLYSGEIDGSYESIRDEIISFQLETGIISDKNDESAGWYGPKTIGALRDRFHIDSDVILREEEIGQFDEYNHKTASSVYKLILEYGDLQVTPESNSDTISELQKLLTKLGEYDGTINGKYSSIETPLIDFQKKVGLISDKEDWGAGYFGNKTKSALWKYYENISEEEIQEIKENVIKVENSEQDDKNTPYTLSSNEKKQIDEALRAIRRKLSRDEKAGKGIAEKRLGKLSEQIEEVLDSIQDELIRAKLVYLQEIL